MYVFDTDVLSLMLKGRLPDKARGRLRSVPDDRRFTTAVTLGELYYGALRSAASTRLLANVEAVERDFRRLDFDGAAARRYGELRSFLECAGRRLDDADLRIAATCSAADMILVSGNARHFSRVPQLRYENWLRGA